MHIENDEMHSIEYLGELDCWDLSMKNQDYANFIANNGFIVHNSRPGPLHCLAYNSLIYDGDINKYVYIETAFGNGTSSTYSMLNDFSIQEHKIKEIIDTGKQPVYELRLTGATACRATLNHRFLTKQKLDKGSKIEWKKLGDISLNDEIMTLDLDYHKIISLIYSGYEQTYDIEMEPSDNFYMNEPNFVADEMVVHNSGQAQSITKAKSEGTYKTWNTGTPSVDDILNDITSTTYGFMVFQEQIMRTMREVGDLSWQEVASIRNAMSKSLGDEFFNKFRAVFIEGSERMHGLPAEQADEIYDHVIHFGNWAFNKAHSVGYSLISWATAYFKAHHPTEFYRSLCNYNEDEKLRKLLREYIEQGHGQILPPKIGKSEYGWTVEGNNLRGGLKDILPEGACNEILALYPIEDADDLADRLENRRKVNSRVWGIIEEHELFSDNDDLDPFNLYEFAERMSRIQDRTHKLGELGYSFGFRDVVVAGIMDRQFNEKSIAELKQSQKLKDFTKTEEYGDAWGIMFLIDETGGPINVHFKNKIYPQYKDWIWQKKVNEDIIVIKGLIPPNMNYIIVRDAWDGEEVKASGGRCFRCPLINSILVPPSGPKDAEVMLLGMVPGRDEVKPENMYPFAGAAGVVLDAEIAKAGSSRKKFRVTNACLCRSATDEDKNRDPTDEEISCCNERLMQEIDEVQPKVIMPLGRIAYKALTGEDVPIGSVEGVKMDWGDYVVIPTYHPASCLYSDGDTKKAKIRNAVEYALKISREMN